VAQIECVIGGGKRSRLEGDQPGIILEVSVGWVQVRSLSGSWRLCRKGERKRKWYALTSLYARYSLMVQARPDRWMATAIVHKYLSL